MMMVSVASYLRRLRLSFAHTQKSEPATVQLFGPKESSVDKITFSFSLSLRSGNSMDPAKVCNPPGGDGVTCIPGCYPPGQQCHEVGHDWTCSFPPERLKDALMHQQRRDSYKNRNNEMIVDIQSIQSRLPDSILAFWRKPNTYADAVQQVVDARANFLQRYGLTVDDGPPLLALDLKGGGDAPFSLSTGP